MLNSGKMLSKNKFGCICCKLNVYVWQHLNIKMRVLLELATVCIKVTQVGYNKCAQKTLEALRTCVGQNLIRVFAFCCGYYFYLYNLRC